MEKIIICYEAEIDRTTELTIAQAVKRLSGYWKPETIEPMLLQGIQLFTPYCTYQLKK
jgi:hypothetical protein